MAENKTETWVDIRLGLGDEEPFVLGRIQVDVRAELQHHDGGLQAVMTFDEPQVNLQIAELLEQAAKRLRSRLAQSSE